MNCSYQHVAQLHQGISQGDYHALYHVLEHRVAVGPLHGPFPCQLLPEQGGRREPGGKMKRC